MAGLRLRRPLFFIQPTAQRLYFAGPLRALALGGAVCYCAEGRLEISNNAVRPMSLGKKTGSSLAAIPEGNAPRTFTRSSAPHYAEFGIMRWPWLFGQISRFDKWNVCRG